MAAEPSPTELKKEEILDTLRTEMQRLFKEIDRTLEINVKLKQELVEALYNFKRLDTAFDSLERYKNNLVVSYEEQLAESIPKTKILEALHLIKTKCWCLKKKKLIELLSAGGEVR